MLRWFKPLVLFIIVLISAGCIKVDIQQVIDNTGQTHIEIQNDFSQLAALGETKDLGLGGSPLLPKGPDLSNFQENLEGACDDFLKDTNLQNPQCEREEYIVTMQGDAVVPSEVFIVEKSLPYITYRYNARHVFDILGETGGEQSKQLDEKTITQAKTGADLLGMKLDYTLNMPAPVLETAVGDIQGNSVTMDVFDLVDKPEAYIVAQEYNWPWIIAAISAVVILLLVGVVVTVLVIKSKFKNRKKAIESESHSSSQPTDQN